MNINKTSVTLCMSSPLIGTGQSLGAWPLETVVAKTDKDHGLQCEFISV